MQSGNKQYHLQLFSGVQHGFALRGNVDDPYERKSRLSQSCLIVDAETARQAGSRSRVSRGLFSGLTSGCRNRVWLWRF